MDGVEDTQLVRNSLWLKARIFTAQCPCDLEPLKCFLEHQLLEEQEENQPYIGIVYAMLEGVEGGQDNSSVH